MVNIPNIVGQTPLAQLPDSYNTEQFVQHLVAQSTDLIGQPSIIIPLTNESNMLYDSDYVQDTLASFPQVQAEPGVTTLSQPLATEFTYDFTQDRFDLTLNLGETKTEFDTVDSQELSEIIYSQLVAGFPVQVYNPETNSRVDARQHSDRVSFYTTNNMPSNIAI